MVTVRKRGGRNILINFIIYNLTYNLIYVDFEGFFAKF